VRKPYDAMYVGRAVRPPTLGEKKSDPPSCDYFFYTESRSKQSTPDDDGSGTVNEENESKSWEDLDANLINGKGYKVQYFGEIECIEYNVGKILKWLDDNKLFDNTIIVFTADHGDMMGEHARIAKGVPLESAARVPFLISYPDKLPKGTVNHMVASTIDFYPTILALAGVKQTATVSGEDMSPYLMGTKAESGWKNIAFLRAELGAWPWLAVVTPEYKLVYGRYDAANNQKGLLIDRVNDPGELYNGFDVTSSDPRYSKYQTAINTLTPLLRTYAKDHGDYHYASYDAAKWGARPKGTFGWFK